MRTTRVRGLGCETTREAIAGLRHPEDEEPMLTEREREAPGMEEAADGGRPGGGDGEELAARGG